MIKSSRPGRVSQLRRQAAKCGFDPDKWFNNVEVLAAEMVGRGTMQYASNIYKYSLAHKMVVEQRQERENAKREEEKENEKHPN